jgi:hypothetical protein
MSSKLREPDHVSYVRYLIDFLDVIESGVLPREHPPLSFPDWRKKRNEAIKEIEAELSPAPPAYEPLDVGRLEIETADEYFDDADPAYANGDYLLSYKGVPRLRTWSDTDDEALLHRIVHQLKIGDRAIKLVAKLVAEMNIRGAFPYLTRSRNGEEARAIIEALNNGPKP